MNQAIDGGVMYLDNSVTLKAVNTPIYQNSAVNRGGAIAFIKSNLGVIPASLASLKNNVDVYENSASDGGLVFVENQYLSVEFI